MRYKATYSPSSLLDPDTYDFLPFEEVCKPILDREKHALFSRIEWNKRSPDEWPPILPEYAQGKEVTSQGDDDMDGSDVPSPPAKTSQDDDSDSDDGDSDASLSPPYPPGFLDPSSLSGELLSQIFTIQNGQLVPLLLSKIWRSGSSSKKTLLMEGVAALGKEGASDCVLSV